MGTIHCPSGCKAGVPPQSTPLPLSVGEKYHMGVDFEWHSKSAVEGLILAAKHVRILFRNLDLQATRRMRCNGIHRVCNALVTPYITPERPPDGTTTTKYQWKCGNIISSSTTYFIWYIKHTHVSAAMETEDVFFEPKQLRDGLIRPIHPLLSW